MNWEILEKIGTSRRQWFSYMTIKRGRRTTALSEREGRVAVK